MFTLVRAGRALAVVFLAAGTLLGSDPTATAAPTPNDKLLTLLSGGYTPADCTPTNQSPSEQDPFLARLDCVANGKPGVPPNAVFSLYATGYDLTGTLQAYAHTGTPLACPGQADPGPIGWSGGMLVCTASPAPVLSGTKSKDLLAVSVTGPDLVALYAWWATAR